MVSAVALSSVIASAGFCPNASFAERGAAHKTLMLTTASDARTIASSRNPNAFFIEISTWHRNSTLRLQPGAIERTPVQHGLAGIHEGAAGRPGPPTRSRVRARPHRLQEVS